MRAQSVHAPETGGDGPLWRNEELGSVNGQSVRLRVVRQRTAPLHSHQDSDELFLCVEGKACLDVDDSTIELGPGDLYVVPRGRMHRLRVENYAALVVVDGIKN
jgi:mannose-6-phosphate isomerase-like protein (cupin superfamily)